jgi:hypothetical protein
MKCLHYVILPLGALLTFAVPLFGAEAIDLKERWIVGKKYYQTMQTVQTSTITIAGKTSEQSNSTTMEVSEAVRAQGDGKGKRTTEKIDRVAVNMSLGGQKVSFDSSKPEENNDPSGLIKGLQSFAGKELRLLVNEKDEITGIENYDEFSKALGASVSGVDVSKMFSKETLIQMMDGHALHSVPGHPVKPGDSWPFSTTRDVPMVGKGAVTGNYTLKGIVDHDGVQGAEIIVDAKVSMDMSGLDSSKAALPEAEKLGAKMKDGTFKGTIWFDPKLGCEREAELTAEVAITMNNLAGDGGTITIPSKQIIHTKLTKIEDLK